MSTTTDQVTSASGGGASHHGSAFFFWLAVRCTALVFVGFGLNAVLNWAGFERFTVWIALHGFFSAAWYLLLINQLRLVRHRDMARHRRFGKLSVWLVLAIVITGPMVTLGLMNLNRPVHPKRLMIASAIQMMSAGVSRLLGLFGLPGPAALVVILALFRSIRVYDWRTDRRLHWSTVASLGIFMILPISFFTVFSSQAWGDWVVSWIG